MPSLNHVDSLTPDCKLEHARALAKAGFKVFPIVPNGKTPAVNAFRQKATTDLQTLEAWFGSGEYNIGVSAEGLCVVDLDDKAGKSGSVNLQVLELLHGDVPTTMTVETPSGGRHLYFKASTPVRNSVSVLGDGIDTRADGGYVLGPGSTVNGRSYRLCDEAPPLVGLPEVPAWISAELKKRKQQADQTAPETLDSEDAIDRAALYLLNDAEQSVEGAGGDATAFRTAARLKDLGVSQQAAVGLMSDFWNEFNSPPWDQNDLTDKIANAYRYGVEPPGNADPAAEFEEYIPKRRNRIGGLTLEYAPDVKPDLDVKSLVDDYLDPGGFSVLYGDPNAGKTFVALDLAQAIATGEPWMGRHKTQKGIAIYVACEGAFGIKRRFEALRQTFGAAKDLVLIPHLVNMGSPDGDVKALIEAVRGACADSNCSGRSAMVVIDTLNLALYGGNENAAEDMGGLVTNVGRLREATGAHVMLLHHTGKDKSAGARGSSVLKGAVDTELFLDGGALFVKKQREREMVKPVRMGLGVVAIGRTEAGEDVTSCVVRWDIAAGAEVEFEKVDGSTPEKMDEAETAFLEDWTSPIGHDREVAVLNFLSACVSEGGVESIRQAVFLERVERTLTGHNDFNDLAQDGTKLDTKKSASGRRKVRRILHKLVKTGHIWTKGDTHKNQRLGVDFDHLKP